MLFNVTIGTPIIIQMLTTKPMLFNAIIGTTPMIFYDNTITPNTTLRKRVEWGQRTVSATNKLITTMTGQTTNPKKTTNPNPKPMPSYAANG